METVGTIEALLGPTNTGKTHRAVERMLEHESGIIGLPLRLLAREIYDRITPRVGERQVALVTGEEKRIPARPRFWVCTVESMPVSREADFLAVDEVQLATHHQRGHIFTDRLLHARGREETWFMGSETMRPVVEELVPTARIARHPRFSTLRSAGATPLGSLPPRTAVIAFSATEVYRIADRLRRRRGGAAVVLGALSPRTRNAQVAMYQAGEVDFVVATDAIGMGLNMDVDHVAFASLRKFDGRRLRQLYPEELAQIAGRAGRHTRDGTFGTVSPVTLPAEVGFAIETHRFARVRRLRWRNSDLDTSSLDALLTSLAERPRRHLLTPVDDAPDHAALRLLANRDAVRQRARQPDDVALLWDVCRIPDFRKLMLEHHAALLEELFVQLRDDGRVSPDFMHQRIGELEVEDGDIDALMMRLELLRTWCYVVHRNDWIEDADAWQNRTRMAEDRLSEALHERLIARFVERRAKPVPRARKRGRLPKQRETPSEPPPQGPFSELWALSRKLAPAPIEVPRDDWLESLIEAEHDHISLTANAELHFDGELVGRLLPGADLTHPDVKIADGIAALGGQRRIARRLRAWLRDTIDELLDPIRLAGEGSGAARGLRYQLEQGLGCAPVKPARDQLRALTPDDRTRLDDHGVVVGRRFVFCESLMLPHALATRAALCTAAAGHVVATTQEPSFARPRDTRWLLPLGYAACGPLAVRVDVVEAALERLSALAAPFSLPTELVDLLACDEVGATAVLTALGYRTTENGWVKRKRRRRRRRD